MRLLLDSQIFLWAVTDDRKLKKAARQRILDANDVFVSSASIWEISTKSGLGKLKVDVDRLVSEIAGSGFSELPVRAAHAAVVRTLPARHHEGGDHLAPRASTPIS